MLKSVIKRKEELGLQVLEGGKTFDDGNWLKHQEPGTIMLVKKKSDGSPVLGCFQVLLHTPSEKSTCLYASDTQQKFWVVTHRFSSHHDLHEVIGVVLPEDQEVKEESVKTDE